VTPPVTGADRLKDLWLPIGPTTVMGGQAAESPNVTGRILELDVSPDGKRVYAASAKGGVWYSRDDGASWLPLGGWFTTPQVEQLDHYANALTSGSIVVDWDKTANGENDTVYVGTGETTPWRTGSAAGKLAGVGVLRATGPAPKARANLFAPVWDREGVALAGGGIYRLAMRPGHPDELVAASSLGFYVRTGGAGPDNWARTTVTPFDTPSVVTDVLWTATHLWIAIMSRGVWRADSAGPPFTKIDLPGLQKGRITLAASTDGSVVYALGDGPRLWRIDDTTAKPIKNVPAALFGAASTGEDEEDEEAERSTGIPEHALPEDAIGQSGYDMVVAVDPDHSEVVVLGGAAIEKDNASLFKCKVQEAAGVLSLDYSPAHDAKTDSPGKDPTFIGYGVHPDVHGATFAKRGTNVDLWIACDGGVYRSTSGGKSYTWRERNNGLAVIEPGYIACHPTSEAVVVAGTQDNGVLQRTGDTAWKWALGGDGGGVAFHPARGDRYVAEAFNANWRSNDYMLTQPVQRHSPLQDHEKEEDHNSSFYSTPGVVAATNAEKARLAIGTNRVWVTEDFGGHWYTIPTKGDPRGPADSKMRHDTAQDVIYRQDDPRSKVLVCRWNGENELFTLNSRSVQRYGRDPASDFWTRTEITYEHKKCSRAYTESDIKGPKMPHLPPRGEWCDLAVHVPAAGGKSTLYVACTSVNGSALMDTLWWFDGGGNWFATKLHDAVKAPALSVAVHPVDGDTVYVGTTVGVWKGKFSRAAGADPHWDWTPYSTGLPEAVVQDLAFFRDPPTGAPTTLLLRAAVESRGVWEVDLLAPCDEKTYLRLHALDTRRRTSTSLADPMRPAGTFSPFESPDVTIRPAQPVSAATMPKPPAAPFLPYKKGSVNTYDLWTFQTAFRQLVPECRPTGEWSKTFDNLLLDYKKANTVGDHPNVAEIDLKTWQNVVTQARVYRAPWDGPVPTEVDLLQLTMDEAQATRRSNFSTRRFNVDVLVHHRGLEALQAAKVSVLLLVRKLTEAEAAWPGLAISAAWKTATVTALTSGSAPGGGWPDHWVVADTTAVRHVVADVDAAHPQVATFQLVFPATTAAGKYMLLAACTSSTTPVTAARLGGATLGDLLAQSSHVAAHRLDLL
jgi:hypothetical protein